MVDVLEDVEGEHRVERGRRHEVLEHGQVHDKTGVGGPRVVAKHRAAFEHLHGHAGGQQLAGDEARAVAHLEHSLAPVERLAQVGHAVALGQLLDVEVVDLGVEVVGRRVAVELVRGQVDSHVTTLPLLGPRRASHTPLLSDGTSRSGGPPAVA